MNLPQLAKFLRTFLRVLLDVVTVFRTGLRSRGALAAENLFLGKQLALYLERKKRPRRATDAVRFTMVLLARFFEWRQALTIVKPDTLIRWHRKGFRLFWKWKSRPGRPRIPQELRQLITNMVRNNPSWGEERIASELLLKIGIQISPRTVRRYMPDQPRRKQSTQSWMTFVCNHARSIIACDFLVVVTATFRLAQTSSRAGKLSAGTGRFGTGQLAQKHEGSGVFKRTLYDNLKSAVKKILQGYRREETVLPPSTVGISIVTSGGDLARDSGRSAIPPQSSASAFSRYVLSRKAAKKPQPVNGRVKAKPHNDDRRLTLLNLFASDSASKGSSLLHLSVSGAHLKGVELN